MNRPLKNVLMFLVMAGLLFTAVSVFLRDKSRVCTKGSGPEAIAACGFMIQYFPLDFMKMLFLSKRVSHYEKAGNKTAALADLMKMASLRETGRVKASGKTMLFIYDRLATLHGELGNNDAAKQYADLAISLGTRDPAVYLSRAVFNLNSLLYSEAVFDLKQAEALGYDKPPLFLNYGAAYLKLNDYENAFLYLNRAEPLLSAPEDKGRLNKLLGQACFGTKRYPEAKQRLQSVLDAGFPCPECSETLAAINELAQPKPAAKPRTRFRLSGTRNNW